MNGERTMEWCVVMSRGEGLSPLKRYFKSRELANEFVYNLAHFIVMVPNIYGDVRSARVLYDPLNVGMN